MFLFSSSVFRVARVHIPSHVRCSAEKQARARMLVLLRVSPSYGYLVAHSLTKL